eukprot:1065806-Amphidinium_carterae.1
MPPWKAGDRQERRCVGNISSYAWKWISKKRKNGKDCAECSDGDECILKLPRTIGPWIKQWMQHVSNSAGANTFNAPDGDNNKVCPCRRFALKICPVSLKSGVSYSSVLPVPRHRKFVTSGTPQTPNN